MSAGGGGTDIRLGQDNLYARVIVAGGGGWYGGGYARRASGGGCSGYVYTSSTVYQYPSGCLLNSSYYLTNAATSTSSQTGNGKARISGTERIQTQKTGYTIPQVTGLTIYLS